MATPKYLYHYTSNYCADQIEKCGYIKAQDPHKGKAGMEFGVYLTALPPYLSDERIKRNNFDGFWQGNSVTTKTEVCFRIPYSDLKGVTKRTTYRNEYLYHHNVYLNEVRYNRINRNAYESQEFAVVEAIVEKRIWYLDDVFPTEKEVEEERQQLQEVEAPSWLVNLLWRLFLIVPLVILMIFSPQKRNRQ